MDLNVNKANWIALKAIKAGCLKINIGSGKIDLSTGEKLMYLNI
jgi:hypothetical protein